MAREQVDRRQAGSHGGLFLATQAKLHLIVEELGGLLQQVHRYEAVGKAAHHVVAVGADGRQFAEVVVQRQGLPRRQPVGPAAQIEISERVV